MPKNSEFFREAKEGFSPEEFARLTEQQLPLSEQVVAAPKAAPHSEKSALLNKNQKKSLSGLLDDMGPTLQHNAAYAHGAALGYGAALSAAGFSQEMRPLVSSDQKNEGRRSVGISSQKQKYLDGDARSIARFKERGVYAGIRTVFWLGFTDTGCTVLFTQGTLNGFRVWMGDNPEDVNFIQSIINNPTAYLILLLPAALHMGSDDLSVSLAVDGRDYAFHKEPEVNPAMRGIYRLFSGSSLAGYYAMSAVDGLYFAQLVKKLLELAPSTTRFGAGIRHWGFSIPFLTLTSAAITLKLGLPYYSILSDGKRAKTLNVLHTLYSTPKDWGWWGRHAPELFFNLIENLVSLAYRVSLSGYSAYIYIQGISEPILLEPDHPAIIVFCSLSMLSTLLEVPVTRFLGPLQEVMQYEPHAWGDFTNLLYKVLGDKKARAEFFSPGNIVKLLLNVGMTIAQAKILGDFFSTFADSEESSMKARVAAGIFYFFIGQARLKTHFCNVLKDAKIEKLREVPIVGRLNYFRPLEDIPLMAKKTVVAEEAADKPDLEVKDEAAAVEAVWAHKAKLAATVQNKLMDRPGIVAAAAIMGVVARGMRLVAQQATWNTINRVYKFMHWPRERVRLLALVVGIPNAVNEFIFVNGFNRTVMAELYLRYLIHKEQDYYSWLRKNNKWDDNHPLSKDEPWYIGYYTRPWEEYDGEYLNEMLAKVNKIFDKPEIKALEAEADLENQGVSKVSGVTPKADVREKHGPGTSKAIGKDAPVVQQEKQETKEQAAGSAAGLESEQQFNPETGRSVTVNIFESGSLRSGNGKGKAAANSDKAKSDVSSSWSLSGALNWLRKKPASNPVIPGLQPPPARITVVSPVVAAQGQGSGCDTTLRLPASASENTPTAPLLRNVG